MFTNLKPSHIVYALLFILALWLIVPAIAGSGNTKQAAQAWPMIEDGALLIDVRTQAEFDAGHLDGAINISWEETSALMDAIGDDKDRPVVVYCRSGNRSGMSKKALDAKGYTNIFNGTGLKALKATKPQP
jgi:phage shock protein E